MSQHKKHIVFTYGTLKTGQPNHSQMMADLDTGTAQYLGTGELTSRFPLVVGTENNLPFLLPTEGKGEYVEGEIFEIDDPKLTWLDNFESHPDFYRRELTNVKVTGGEVKSEGRTITLGQMCDCWCYFLPKFSPEMLKLKMLKSYSSLSGDHSPYVEGEDMTSLPDL